jgi:DNA-binding MarR family transcriptional regulator
VISDTDVSHSEFYSVFEGLDDCLLAAFDEGLERIRRLIVEATGCDHGWSQRLRAVVSAVLVFLDEEPGWARLLIDESPIASPALAERRHAALVTLAGALASETQVHANRSGWFLPSGELTAELVVGGVFSGLRAHLLKGPNEPFVELAPSLIAFIEAPYQAAGLLSETIGKGVDATDAGGQRMPLRTTYRTTRVLHAIGETAGLSNRETADAAGLVDEGQTSKLLRRLERRGLIENTGMGQTYGGANAWSLTAYGQRVLDATRHSLAPGAGAVRGRRVRGAA